MPIDHARILANDWLQGSVLTETDSANLLDRAIWRPKPVGLAPVAGTRLLLASHSCDVVSPSEIEEHVEFCPAIPLAPGTGLGQYGYARNPRQLRVHLQINAARIEHHLYAPLRFTAPRSVLETIQPDPAALLPIEELEHFAYWLSLRFRRRTFPNEFDRRLGNENHKKIRKALATVEEHVDALLYSLSSNRDLGPAEIYAIRVVLLAKESSLEIEGVIESLEKAKSRIQTLLSKSAGIALDEISLESNGSMPVSVFNSYDNWGFEDLSWEAFAEAGRH